MTAVLLAIAVSSADAIWAVRGWTREGGTLAVVGAPVSATAHNAEDGGKYFSVKTTFGTVFVAGDTSDEPIIAFTGGGEDLSELDENSPLAALLARRRKSADNKLRKWNRLLSNGAPTLTLLSAAATSGLETSGIGDMRVEPLVKSKWGQANADSRNCFNYYTPSNCACGCVATAMGQIMKFHRYPDYSVTPMIKECFFNGVATNCMMKGGVYDWDSMVDEIVYVLSDKQAEAMGRIVYDAAVSVRMIWNYPGNVSGSSGSAYGCYSANAFNEVFGYASAAYLDAYEIETPVSPNDIGDAILSNLDAGYPVNIGICGVQNITDVGHSVVLDGYGFKNDTLYVHLNMGWWGQSDLWYSIPVFSTGDIAWNELSDVIYNIIPGSDVKSVLSGRITYGGSGMGGIAVRLYRGDELVASTNANEYGVYGFTIDEAATDYVVTVPVSIYNGTLENIEVLMPVTEEVRYMISEKPPVYLKEKIKRVVRSLSHTGNSWGNDIELKDVIVAATDGNGGGIAIPASWFTNYYESAVAEASTVDALAELAGQTAANGVNSVAECYVALLDPTNENSRFVAYITFDDDSNPQIDWSPKDETRREYVVSNSSDLAAWKLLPDTATNSFFKVGVKLK